MKTLTAAMATKLAEPFGNESICILEIQWVTDGQWNKYADKAIPSENIPGVILNLGSLETVVKVTGSGSSQNISVILNDIDGTLKNIINYNDVHGKTARVYQWLEEVPFADRFMLLEGQISSPLKWNEGSRTFSFDITTKTEDKEIGFSPEEGEFPFIPDNLIGKPWPLAFGTVENIPGAHLKESPECETLNPVYIKDPTLEWDHASMAYGETMVLKTMAYDYTIEEEIALAKPWLTPAQRAAEVRRQQQEIITDATNAGIFFDNQKVFQNSILTVAEARWDSYIGLTDPELFPQYTDIYLVIDGVLFRGEVRDDGRFYYSSKDRLDFNISVWNETNKTAEMNAMMDYLTDTSNRYVGWLFEPLTPGSNKFTSATYSRPEPYAYSPTSFAGPGLKVVDAGSKVELAGQWHVTYIANLIPSTIIHVKAYRNVNGREQLVRIAERYYTVSQEELGGYSVCMITMEQSPVSLGFANDDIYITLNSTVGPNTVDIMEWLITTYTDLTWDETSFDHVKTLLENYPSHFAFLDRKNIMQVLEEMAYQCRCAIWISQSQFYLKYLPEQQSTVATVVDADVDFGTLEIEITLESAFCV